ncbi:hypothetical protein BD769DRAFT_1397879 [Suillus cothurnatus]|nr:hypothetical protein BD769DRAFT_1397879 [Suillus cothurnatus]
MKTTNPSLWICIHPKILASRTTTQIYDLLLIMASTSSQLGRLLFKFSLRVHQSPIISRAGPTPRESFLAAGSLLVDADGAMRGPDLNTPHSAVSGTSGGV